MSVAAMVVDLNHPHRLMVEARQTSPTLYNEEDLQSRLSRPEEDMRFFFSGSNKSSSVPQQQHSLSTTTTHGSPAVVMSRKHSRRKQQQQQQQQHRDTTITTMNALQELDDTVASIGSCRRGGVDATSWNDGDSQSCQTIATQEGTSTSHRSLIANMRDIKDMRGRSLPNPYVVGQPRSVSSRRSRGSRTTSSRSLSRRSSSIINNRKHDALERMVSLTLLETATSEDAESHFLSIAEDTSFATAITTHDILHDLITVSTIVEQERCFRDSSTTTSSLSPSSASQVVPKNPKPLLPNVSGDLGEALSSYDNVDYNAPVAARPIFFKIQKQAAQTIPEEGDSPRQQQQQHHRSSLGQSHSSPTDPFTHLDRSNSTRETQRWSKVDHRPRQASPAPSPPRTSSRRMVKDLPPSPKQLFEQPQHSLADEDGFPTTPQTTEVDTPQGAAVASFFQSQMDAPSALEWNSAEEDWTTFETSPFEASSPNSVVVDTFHAAASMIRPTASVDSGYGSKYSI